jgi:hypothetical protein
MFPGIIIPTSAARIGGVLCQAARGFARMTGRAGKLQHFRYGVSKVRGRWYYRYHKPIGRANWKAYQERYIRPKDVEAKQRLVFAPKATTRQLKQSLSWQWRLPKLLAASTTPNQVLDAWILFRYRNPKKVHHFMETLKRLDALGGCDPTDWRFQILLSRLRRVYKRVTRVDHLVKYLARLNLHSEMERLTGILIQRIPDLNLAQQISILESFGIARLRDTQVAGLLVRHIRRKADCMSTSDKIQVISSLGQMDVRQTVLVSEWVDDILSSTLSVGIFRRLIQAVGSSKIRDFSLAEMAVEKCISSIAHKQVNTYSDCCFVLRELSAQGILEPLLAETIMEEIDPMLLPLNAVLAALEGSISLLDSNALAPYFLVLRQSIDLLKSPADIVQSVKVVDTCFDSIPDSSRFLEELANQYLRGSNPSGVPFNVSELADVFARRRVNLDGLWTRVASDIPRVIEHFEPNDLLRISDAMISGLPENTLNDDELVSVSNSVVSWTIRRKKEFTRTDFARICSVLENSAAIPKLRSNLVSSS